MTPYATRSPVFTFVHRPPRQRRLLAAVSAAALGVAVLFAAACGGDGDDERVAALEAEVEALQARVAELEGAARIGGASDDTAARLGAAPSPTASPSATPTPKPEPTSVPIAAPVLRYIGDTGGEGVSLRSDCSDEARAAGGLHEGADVFVEEEGVGQCVGWSVVSSGATRTWVRDDYLVDEPPVQPMLVTALSSYLAEPFVSTAYTFCIDYDQAGVPGQICQTFPTVPRELWMQADLERYGQLSDDRLAYFKDCYTNPPAIGELVPACAFEELSG